MVPHKLYFGFYSWVSLCFHQSASGDVMFLWSQIRVRLRARVCVISFFNCLSFYYIMMQSFIAISFTNLLFRNTSFYLILKNKLLFNP